MWWRKKKTMLTELPLVFRQAWGCNCKECAKIFGNGYFNDGINEDLVGPCEGQLKDWKISQPNIFLGMKPDRKYLFVYIGLIVAAIILKAIAYWLKGGN